MLETAPEPTTARSHYQLCQNSAHNQVFTVHLSRFELLLLGHSNALDSSMGKKEVLEQRMQALGWTQYRLVQEICKLRQSRGKHDATVTRYQSSISKALKDPDNVKTYIIDDVIEALGGEQIIRWKSYEDVKL